MNDSSNNEIHELAFDAYAETLRRRAQAEPMPLRDVLRHEYAATYAAVVLAEQDSVSWYPVLMGKLAMRGVEIDDKPIGERRRQRRLAEASVPSYPSFELTDDNVIQAYLNDDPRLNLPRRTISFSLAE